jgi:DNA (cytosine-5)-methyltransferase 1
MFRSIELCAGGGGQALGLEQAGFEHVALVENDFHACQTLKKNRPYWNVIEGNLQDFDAFQYKGIDLIAGGVPCPPFSHAGKQLGENDERNLFDEALRVIEEAKPRAIMLENVRGLLDPKFDAYRSLISKKLDLMGYFSEWRLLNASDFGVPQLRPRVILVALDRQYEPYFSWPLAHKKVPPTVGEVLFDLIASNGWEWAEEWQQRANNIAPTIVGGSKKHGGPDLGPTRAKKAWAGLGVNGHRLADTPPEKGFYGKDGFERMPYLTVEMVSRLQGFPDDWKFFGKKTNAYRQIGNAFPPPVAKAVGLSIIRALNKVEKVTEIRRAHYEQLKFSMAR